MQTNNLKGAWNHLDNKKLKACHALRLWKNCRGPIDDKRTSRWKNNVDLQLLELMAWRRTAGTHRYWRRDPDVSTSSCRSPSRCSWSLPSVFCARPLSVIFARPCRRYLELCCSACSTGRRTGCPVCWGESDDRHVLPLSPDTWEKKTKSEKKKPVTTTESHFNFNGNERRSIDIYLVWHLVILTLHVWGTMHLNYFS